MEKPYLLPVCDSGANPDSINCTFDITKPSCTFLKLTGINLLAFGLELCASAGFTYIPPVMLKNGFSEKSLSIILGVGPFISLVLVPFIGHWSDRCESRFGRRRPFMLVLSIIMIFSLMIIPFNHEICTFLKFLHPNFGLAVGVILLDFSSQALMNPCKALIPDVFHSIEEQSSGFTAYSCMLSLGGCLGYFITSLNWTSTFLGNVFGGQEKAVFSILALVLFILLVVNLHIANERPFEKKESLLNEFSLDKNYNDCKPTQNDFFDSDMQLLSTKTPPILDDFNEYSGRDVLKSEKNTFYTLVVSFTPIVSFKRLMLRIKNFLYSWASEVNTMFVEYVSMPPVLVQLFLACLFGWMGIMCHDMYFTDFVGQVIYKGDPQSQKDSKEFKLYNEGVRMGSWGLLLHCLIAALYAAFFQNKLIKDHGKSRIYLLGMVCFTLSLLGTIATNSLLLVTLFAGLSGLGLAAITTVPYALITEYYCKKKIYYNDKNRGLGEDMAVLDSAVFLSQIIPSLFLGYIVEYTKTSATYMFVSALCGALACYFAYFVTFT